MEVVANMGKGVCPDIRFSSASDFYASVWDQLPYFMGREVEVKEGDTKVKKLLMARPALMVGFEEIRTKMASKVGDQVARAGDLPVLQVPPAACRGSRTLGLGHCLFDCHGK